MVTKSLPVLIAAGLLAGCSTHNPLIVTNRADVAPLGEFVTAPHERRVPVIEVALPPEIGYERIARIDVGRVWYASRNAARRQLAETARKLGADAVIDVRIWLQPSGFAWVAPHGRGVAVRFSDPAGADEAAGLGPAF